VIDSDRSIDDFVMALNHIHELPYIEQHRKKLQMEVDALTRQISVLSKKASNHASRSTCGKIGTGIVDMMSNMRDK